MGETRDRWLEAIDRHRLHPRAPGDERYWAPELETASRDELRAVQSDKLPLAVAYMAEHAPMYADKLRDAGFEPGDIGGWWIPKPMKTENNKASAATQPDFA